MFNSCTPKSQSRLLLALFIVGVLITLFGYLLARCCFASWALTSVALVGSGFAIIFAGQVRFDRHVWVLIALSKLIEIFFLAIFFSLRLSDDLDMRGKVAPEMILDTLLAIALSVASLVPVVPLARANYQAWTFTKKKK